MRDLELLDNLIVGRVEPHIYAFSTNTVPNYLKVGDTYRPVSVRLKEWQTHYPELEKKFENTAKVGDDVFFRDYSVHQFLESYLQKERLKPEILDSGIYYSNEFFKETDAGEVSDAIADIASDYDSKGNKYQFYNALTALPTTVRYASTGYLEPRPNQQATINAFKRAVENGRTNLLMYAVMRFGKSFTSMCCAKEMDGGNGARLVVVISAKADVKEEWRKTIECAENFRNDYEFLSSLDLEKNHSIVTDTLDRNEGIKKVVLFLTLQDLQGDLIKDKHQQIFEREVDLLIIDETHFGARAEKYGQVLKNVQFKGEKAHNKDDDDYIEISDAEEQIKAFDARVKLHLSGTPYRILMGSEFQKDDIIAFYQFSDIVQEQEAWDKENLLRDDEKEWMNPYYGFPQMIRFAFNPNESSIRRLEELRISGITYAFSALLKPKSIKKADDGSHKEFIYESEIIDLLEVIDGSKEDDNLLGFLDYDKIKSGMMCRHLVCVLPYCAACDALEALIKSNAARFRNLSQYEIVNISGVDSPNAYKTPKAIKDAIKKFETEGKKTITLTVNRMLTGSTVEEWDTMLYLKDTASPQEYDQAIFRLQNQYVRTYKDENGDIIKYNMKPQTLLVDFDPNRMFHMQEQKAQIYNVNVDDAGNSKLSERVSEELRISPIIVMNKNKIEQISATDILKAVSEYSRNRGVAEETNDIPVDLALMDIADIWDVIKQENELGSKSGFKDKAAEGEGGDTDVPEPGEGDEHDNNTATDTSDADTTTDTGKNEANEDTPKKDPAKQFRMYYARILYFAFLTKDTIISLDSIIDCINTYDNARIFRNLGLNKAVLESLKNHMDKFMLRTLDYKIQNLNQLSHDENVSPLERAIVANQKLGKLGESQVVTPSKVSDDMIALLPEEFLRGCIEGGKGILDIASKEGEFAIALCKRYETLGIDRNTIKDIVYSIPTSSITYEFTRKIYEVLGLNVNNIAERFNSYDLLNIKDNSNDLDYAKIRTILSQDKPFNEISIENEVAPGGEEKMLKFGAVVGNPPYQENMNNTSDNPIYHLFMDSAFELSDKVCLITPARFLFNAGKTPKAWNIKMLNDEHLRVAKYEQDSSKVFPGMSFTGGIAITYRDRDENFGKIIMFTPYEELNAIIQKVINDEFTSIDRLIYSPESYKFSKKLHVEHTDVKSRLSSGHMNDIVTNIFGKLEDIFFDNKPNDEKEYIQIFGLEGKNRVYKWIQKDFVKSHDNLERFKVFLPKSNGSGAIGEIVPTSLIGEPIVGGPFIGHTQSFISIGNFQTEFEAKAVLKYVKTKFARTLLGTLKVTQDNKKDTWKNVPLQDFTNDSDIDWNKCITEIDKQLYAKYGLAQGEIDYIESMIKPMD